MKRLLLRLIPLFLEHLGVHFAVVPLGHQIGNFSLLGLLEETPRKGHKTNTQQHHNNNSSKQSMCIRICEHDCYLYPVEAY